MYFIEFILKKIFSKKKSEIDEHIPAFEQKEEIIDECKEHVFMPIDSSGEILSCVNCGLVVHKKNLHNKNPF